MANLASLVGQQKIFFIIGAAFGSFMLGVIMPASPPYTEEFKLPAPQLTSVGKKEKQDLLNIKTAVNQRIEGFTTKAAQIQEQYKKRFNFSVPARFQGAITYEIKLSGKEKVVALTFDDGPWPDTLPILNILKQNKIKATFFWIGRHLQTYPEIGKKVVAEGHAVGNHTWNHQYHQVDHFTATREIEDTGSLIYKITGVKTAMFRPPGGILNNGLAAYAQAQKMVVAMWSTDTKESYSPSPEEIINTVLSNAQSGAVVLMHDGGGNHSNTLKALPQIIAGLKKRGYKFVTLPELLEMQDKELVAQAKSANLPTEKP
ncbi:polysaccharide deacetylase family protein [Microcoleus sp. FACHB-672]|uniref:polysaccharide deacetylase family protein n=1 Tax=Microcoleus sp. FACHB-672 TaxID=2692825 RepID=UPI0016832263|nr:polysaccharide deacetylase family protein [Microcoleus sp. FACHB-672]MBD2041351.1 polysaccharide deacetylase family protein [Microcoleus sp. FACHB-672]